MKKTIMIEGMSCGHCVGRVEKALQGLDGVTSVQVDLAGKCAVVELSQDIANEVLVEVIDEAGYDVTSVQ